MTEAQYVQDVGIINIL